MVEVQRGDVVTLAFQPKEGRNTVHTHRDSQVVGPIFGQDLFDDFDHFVGNSPRTKILSPSSVGRSRKQMFLARSEVVSGSMIE